MSTDAMTPLRALLRKIDGTAPGIQSCAGAMMRLYDRASGVAVVEWRNALQQARKDQLVPLLYVANEVLQNSKRNRGNKFLEAFSPVLGQALRFIAEQHADTTGMVEKIRRTVKIWGDRSVFSVRFVSELLEGLEPYRNGAAKHRQQQQQRLPSPDHTAAFSPPHQPPGSPASLPSPGPDIPAEDAAESKPATSTPLATAETTATATTALDIDAEMRSGMGIGGDSDSDDGDLFDAESDNETGEAAFGTTDGVKLDIHVDLDRHADAATSTPQSAKKRRRSTGSAGSNSNVKKNRRSSILSTSSLMNLWNQVESLQKSYDHAQAVLANIAPNGKLDEDDTNRIETLVGDELLQSYKTVLRMQHDIVTQRRELHRIAHRRRALEQECIRYLPWLERALVQDADDIAFCAKLDERLRTCQRIHGIARQARAERRAKELERQQKEAEQERAARDKEERRKLFEAATRKETEAKPGMVWNKATGEYQYMNTEESWRD